MLRFDCFILNYPDIITNTSTAIMLIDCTIIRSVESTGQDMIAFLPGPSKAKKSECSSNTKIIAITRSNSKFESLSLGMKLEIQLFSPF